ncbi:MAG: hypothetical protein ACI957_000750 [Verrucomicrobiales bacterium]
MLALVGATAYSQIISQTSLAKRPSTTGPLFTEQSGLSFAYEWSPPEKYAHEMVNAVTGGGVCMGDFDADGLTDVFLTQPFKGNRLYRNLGGWKFEDVTQKAGLTKEHLWGTGASFGDLDNDGDLDLFVCGYDCENRYYVNLGNGTFIESARKAGLNYRGASVMVAFADYDLDGDLDAYLCNNHIDTPEPPLWKYSKDANGMPIVPADLKGIAKPLYRPDLKDGMLIPAGESDRLYQNNGDGTFTDVSAKAGIHDEDFGLSCTWWDFDDDGDPDLYNSNDFYGADHLYRNNGDGTFTNVNQLALPHTPWFSMGSDVADINNDGLLDFMASDMQGTTHYKQKISMGDMQGWFLETAMPRQYMRNALYINTGTDRLQEAAFLAGVASTDWTWSLKFADLDSDGKDDLYVTNGAERYWDNSDIMNAARGAQRINTPELRKLWIPSPVRNDRNLAYRNQGDLQFEDVSETWGLNAAKVSYGAAFGDLDNDGDLDLVVNNFDQPASLYQNNEHKNQLALISLQGTRSNSTGLGALLHITSASTKQTKVHTLTRGFMSANAPHIAMGLGADTKFDLTIEWPSGIKQPLKGLAAGKHHLIKEQGTPAAKAAKPETMFVTSEALRGASVTETPYDDFAREPLLPNKLSQLGPGMAWGDIDADGDDDLILSRPTSRATSVIQTQPVGFKVLANPALAKHAKSEDMAPLLFDADSDGDIDLLVASGGVEAAAGSVLYHDRLYLNDGKGTFQPAPTGTLPTIPTSSSVTAAADHDRDGDLDLFIGTRLRPGSYPLSNPSRLLRNDQGKFIDITGDWLDMGMVTSAIWSDTNNDGWLDLLVLREWGAPLLLTNSKGTLIDASKDAGLTALTGWWNGIASGDLNHDGAIDFVITNTGLNTKYHPDQSHPARLYYGDMDGTGKSQIIEAKAYGQTWLPVRGKSCSQNAMPGLRTAFPTFQSFAEATLTDIYTSERLQNAQTFNATELRSGILLNNGQGTFRFEPLPHIAQISASFGVTIAEINGDGHPDIYLLQNAYSPQPETGRIDGGLSQLLLGNGDGTFQPVPAHESGLTVSGDGKSLAAVDLNRDGWVDFVATCNSGPMHTFINRGHPTNHGLSFRLQGLPGNPTGVGARLTLTCTDTPKQVTEISAGGSYLSQSPGMAFFGVPSGSKPTELEVQWPDGESLKVALDSIKGQRLLIRHPKLGK